MAKYQIEYSVAVHYTVEIEADNEEDARWRFRQADSDVDFSRARDCGDGGVRKIISVYEAESV